MVVTVSAAMSGYGGDRVKNRLKDGNGGWNSGTSGDAYIILGLDHVCNIADIIVSVRSAKFIEISASKTPSGPWTVVAAKKELGYISSSNTFNANGFNGQYVKIWVSGGSNSSLYRSKLNCLLRSWWAEITGI